MRISDWSSDVCSSDLILEENVADAVAEQDIGHERLERERSAHHHVAHFAQLAPAAIELVGLGHIEAGPCADLPAVVVEQRGVRKGRSEEHTSELQSLMRISYAVFCLQKKKQHKTNDNRNET